MDERNKVADALADLNDIISQFIPIIPNFMAIIGLFLRSPNVQDDQRAKAIAAMRSHGTKLIVTSEAWLAEHGYDENGDKLPLMGDGNGTPA